MKPTKIISEPYIVDNGARGERIYPTDIGPMTKEEIGEAIEVKPSTWYERYRRKGWKAKGLFAQKMFNPRNTLDK